MLNKYNNEIMKKVILHIKFAEYFFQISSLYKNH